MEFESAIAAKAKVKISGMRQRIKLKLIPIHKTQHGKKLAKRNSEIESIIR